MSGAFLSGLAAGYGIAIPVGAIAVLIVLTAARDSFGAGLAAGLGAATADLVYATVAMTAGSATSRELHSLRVPLHIVGGAVLVVIAVRGLATAGRPPAERSSGDSSRRAATYIRFVGLTLVNPLTVIYFVSVVLGKATGSAFEAAVFICGVALASASWQTVLAASGALAGRTLLDRGGIVSAWLGYGVILLLGLHQFQQT